MSNPEEHTRKRSRFDEEGGVKTAQERAREIAARLATIGASPTSASNGTGGAFGTVTKKVYCPVREYPDVNFTGLLIGPKGSTHRNLEEQTGTKIKFRGRGSARDGEREQDPDDDMHVLIIGDRDDKVKRAEDMVRAIIFDEDKLLDLKRRQLVDLGTNRIDSDPNLKVVEMKIAKGNIGLVIGKGGETIRDLKDRSGAFIQIDDSANPSDQFGTLQIRGRQECVEKAEQLIQKLISDMDEQHKARGGGGIRQVLDIETDIAVDNDRVGLVIGKGGITVKGIQDRLNCRIEIPRVPDASNPLIRTLVIRCATVEDGEAAKKEILRVIAPLESDGQYVMAQPQSTDGEVYVVPNNKVGLIIGKSGSTIKMIQSKTGCDIQIPQHPDPGTNNSTRSIQLNGSPAQCNAARLEIEAVLDEYDRGGSSNYQAGNSSYQGGNSNYQTGSSNYQAGSSDYQASTTGYNDMQAQQLQWQQYYAQQAMNITENTSDQKYTREQWRDWKEYYAQFGYPMQEDPPPHLLAE